MSKKKRKAKTSTPLLFFLFLVPIFLTSLYISKRLSQPFPAVKWEQPTVAERVEHAFSNSFPLETQLKQWALDIQYATGTKEVNGIFLTEETLLKNVSEQNEDDIRRNNHALNFLIREILSPQQSAYFLMIPTATGVLREQVPQYTEPVNQRNVIDSTYNQLTEVIPTIDVYNTLLHNREKYIFYRTENNLTPIGGYYVYEQLTKRMLGETAPRQNEFGVLYASYDFYGDLYQEVPFRKVEPDVLMQYYYPYSAREFLVTKKEESTGNTVPEQRFYTPYPALKEEKQQGMELYFGGMSSVTEIVSTGGEKRSLLLLGDETVLAYLPFLSYHYNKITVVDLENPDFSDLDVLSYQHVLVGCSADTYMNSTAVADTIQQITTTG